MALKLKFKGKDEGKVSEIREKFHKALNGWGPYNDHKGCELSKPENKEFTLDLGNDNDNNAKFSTDKLDEDENNV